MTDKRMKIDSWFRIPVELFEEIDEPIGRLKQQRFTFEPDSYGDYGEEPDPIKAYKEEDGYLCIPRVHGSMIFSDYSDMVDDNTALPDEPIDIEFTKELWDGEGDLPNQKKCYEKFFKEVVAKNKLGGIIKAPPGSGKTVLGARLIAEVDLPTIVLVHKDFLMRQWEERLVEFTTLEKEDIGRIHQDKVQYDRPVVLGMMQTIMQDSRSYPDEVTRSFGLTVIDEVHVAGARKLSDSVTTFPSRFKAGLSATPDRKDGLMDVVRGHIGYVQSSINEYQLKPKVYRIVLPQFPRIKRLNDDIPIETMKTELTKCGKRNYIVQQLLNKAIDNGRKILVLTDRLAHVDELIETTKANVDDDVSIGKYVGDMKEREQKRSEQCDVIIGTSSKAKEGLDIPDLDCMFLTIPRADVRQMVGRTLRSQPGKDQPIVVDFIDQHDYCQNVARKRHDFYQDQGFDVEVKKPMG